MVIINFCVLFCSENERFVLERCRRLSSILKCKVFATEHEMALVLNINYILFSKQMYTIFFKNICEIR